MTPTVSTYVVGIDATDEGHAALDWATAVAGAQDRIVAVHAWQIPVVTGYETAAAVDVAGIERAARAFVTDEIDRRGDARVSGRVLSGSPGASIVDVVDELAGASLAADVTAVVGHARSGKVGLLLGSTANHVVRHARATTVVVRGESRLPVRRLVVGMDEPGDRAPDERSLAALRWAVGLPGVERIEVHHAAFVPAVAAGALSQPGIESEQEIAVREERLRAAVAAAVGDPSAASTSAQIVPLVTGGTGAFDLIEASRDADLIVVGTRGRSAWRDLVTGSTTLEVTAHAHCPVAVVG